MPAGNFVMGNPGSECEEPCICGTVLPRCVDPRCSISGCPGYRTVYPGGQHPVTISHNLLVKKTEVTNEEWTSLYTWMDVNALFYGTFDVAEQKRQLAGKMIDPPKE